MLAAAGTRVSAGTAGLHDSVIVQSQGGKHLGSSCIPQLREQGRERGSETKKKEKKKGICLVSPINGRNLCTGLNKHRTQAVAGGGKTY